MSMSSWSLLIACCAMLPVACGSSPPASGGPESAAIEAKPATESEAPPEPDTRASSPEATGDGPATPVPREPVEPGPPTATDGDMVTETREGDEPEGVEGGVLSGPGSGNPPPPPPPPKDEPKIVPVTAIEAQRISGDKQIAPPDEVRLEMKEDGKTRLVSTMKMCVDKTGRVSSLNWLKTTGYKSYDKMIEAAMKKWRYKPFTVNGKPVNVCTAVTFVYVQNNDDAKD